MKRRSLFRPFSLSFFLAAGLLAARPGWAGDLDPLATEALVPARPVARGQGLPCAETLPAMPLAAVDAVDIALCNNPQTREVWASARAQAAQVGVAEAAWLPRLDGKATAARYVAEPRDYSQQTAALTLSWVLYDFGQRSASLRSARELLAVAAATQDATVQTLLLSVLQGYYGAQAARAAVASSVEAERAARESFKAAESRYAVGTGTPADRLQAQTAWSQATLNRIKAEGEARNALGTLANALGFTASQPLTLAEAPEMPALAAAQQDIDALIADARRRRPDLAAAEAQLRAAQAGVDLARAQGQPSISLGAGPTWQNLAGNSSHGGSLGLTLTVPLFTGFDAHYRERAAAAQVAVRTAQRDRLRNQVALEVWKAYQGLSTAGESVKAAADLVASAEQSARVALGRYQAGVGNVLDVLSAQSALAGARLQRIQAQLDWHVYRATLAQAMGALDDTLLRPAAQERP